MRSAETRGATGASWSGGGRTRQCWRWALAFLLTPWFFFLGIGVVLARLLRMDLSRYPWGV